MGYYHQLRLAAELVEVSYVLVYVHIVERRVYLVEHTERRRTVLEYREVDRDGDHRLLAAGEGYQVLYDLSRRCREYLNTGIQNVLRVGELEFAVRSVAENADEYLLEALVYLLKAVEEARLDILGEVGD